MNKCLILTAKEYNWSLIGPGDWCSISWKIYSDKSFRVNIWFNPGEESDLWGTGKKIRKRFSGVMPQELFDSLLNLLSIDNWGNPDRWIDACDGSAWEIRQYSSEEEIIGTSGRIGYIYGDEILERIVSCLPDVYEKL